MSIINFPSSPDLRITTIYLIKALLNILMFSCSQIKPQLFYFPKNETHIFSAAEFIPKKKANHAVILEIE